MEQSCYILYLILESISSRSFNLILNPAKQPLNRTKMFKLLALALLSYSTVATATDFTMTTLPGTSTLYTETEPYYHPTGSSSIIRPDLPEPTGGHSDTDTHTPSWSHPIGTPTTTLSSSASIVHPTGSSTSYSMSTTTTTTVKEPEFKGAAAVLRMDVPILFYAAVGAWMGAAIL
ncbi:hypothetical protein BJX66DRAFT_290088 [Aspergillus keveii]|uniref:Uncharacterized protein n=1 Tax=Aspergillus keveii TaxID=714993 RepID=A0ABR4GNX6_9EURO